MWPSTQLPQSWQPNIGFFTASSTRSTAAATAGRLSAHALSR